jgi:hypothetical protein
MAFLIRHFTPAALLLRRLNFGSLALSASLFLGGTSVDRAAAAEPAPETRLKAALIYRFTTLTEWPAASFPSPEAPVLIGIIGREPLEEAIRRVAEGKRIGARPIVVVGEHDLGKAGQIHVLVFAEGTKQQFSERLDHLADKPVLTLGDVPGFIPAGGMIRLRREGAKLTFDINIKALRQAEPAGLKLNPQVLKLGRIVEGGGDEE